jgi:hypothetical protein
MPPAVGGMTGLNHHLHLLLSLGLKNFTAQSVLNCDSPDLCLPRSKDFWCEPVTYLKAYVCLHHSNLSRTNQRKKKKEVSKNIISLMEHILFFFPFIVPEFDSTLQGA